MTRLDFRRAAARCEHKVRNLIAIELGDQGIKISPADLSRIYLDIRDAFQEEFVPQKQPAELLSEAITEFQQTARANPEDQE